MSVSRKREVRSQGRRGSNAGRRATTEGGQETLAAILEAASDIASQEGLERLSMRRLAQAVGMSKSGLYAHFSSKEEIQLATLQRVLEVFDAEVLRGTPDAPDPGLGGLLERWLGFFEHRVFLGGCFIITSAVEFASRRGPVFEALHAALDKELDALGTSIDRAIEAGELSAERDTRQTAFELHSILMNAHAMFQVKRDPAVFEQARAALRRLLE